MASSAPGSISSIFVPAAALSSRRPDTKSLCRCVSRACVNLTPSCSARVRYRSTSRVGSTTTPMPRSASTMRKLAFPSSGAGSASTVNIHLSPYRHRSRRQQDPDRDERDQHCTAVENHLRGRALGGRDAQVDEQVAQSVGEVKEGQRDQHEQVQLHDGIAEQADPGVVVTVDHVHEPERPQDALDQDVDRDEHSGDHAALREHEPPEQVREGGFAGVSSLGAHRPNQISTKPITIEASAHRPNCDSTINLEGTSRPRNLTWMITPARLRNVVLWYIANRKHTT